MLREKKTTGTHKFPPGSRSNFYANLIIPIHAELFHLRVDCMKKYVTCVKSGCRILSQSNYQSKYIQLSVANGLFFALH